MDTGDEKSTGAVNRQHASGSHYLGGNSRVPWVPAAAVEISQACQIGATLAPRLVQCLPAGLAACLVPKHVVLRHGFVGERRVFCKAHHYGVCVSRFLLSFFYASLYSE